jgi:multiple sugar transport system substrate-binding protein
MNVFGRHTAALLMVGTLLVSACGGSTTSAPLPTGSAGTPPSSGGSPAPSVSAQATSGPPVTLNLWIFEGEDQIVPTFISDFEKIHPNITLKETLIPEDLYATKMDTAFAAGAPPDIAFVYQPTWMKAGDFLPINDLMASNNIDVSKFAQTALSSCELNGTLYCIGSYTGLYVLYYDKQLFDAAGLPYPSATVGMSVDTYAADAKKLAVPNSDLSKRVWGATTGGPEADVDNADFVSPDGRTATGYFDSPKDTHALAVLAHMANDKSGISWNDIGGMGLNDAYDLMASHQIGMTPDDNTALPKLDAMGVNVGIAPPYVEAEGDPTWIPEWTDAWGVTTKSAHPDEAKQFLVWVATQGQQVRADAGDLPLNLQFANQINWAGNDPLKQQMLSMAAMGRPYLFVPNFAADLSPIVDDTYSQIVNDESALNSIMQKQTKVFQTQLNQDWTTWDSIK